MPKKNAKAYKKIQKKVKRLINEKPVIYQKQPSAGQRKKFLKELKRVDESSKNFVFQEIFSTIVWVGDTVYDWSMWALEGTWKLFDGIMEKATNIVAQATMVAWRASRTTFFFFWPYFATYLNIWLQGNLLTALVCHLPSFFTLWLFNEPSLGGWIINQFGSSIVEHGDTLSSIVFSWPTKFVLGSLTNYFLKPISVPASAVATGITKMFGRVFEASFDGIENVVSKTWRSMGWKGVGPLFIGAIMSGMTVWLFLGSETAPIYRDYKLFGSVVVKIFNMASQKNGEDAMSYTKWLLNVLNSTFRLTLGPIIDVLLLILENVWSWIYGVQSYIGLDFWSHTAIGDLYELAMCIWQGKLLTPKTLKPELLAVLKLIVNGEKLSSDSAAITNFNRATQPLKLAYVIIFLFRYYLGWISKYIKPGSMAVLGALILTFFIIGAWDRTSRKIPFYKERDYLQAMNEYSLFKQIFLAREGNFGANVRILNRTQPRIIDKYLSIAFDSAKINQQLEMDFNILLAKLIALSDVQDIPDTAVTALKVAIQDIQQMRLLLAVDDEMERDRQRRRDEE